MNLMDAVNKIGDDIARSQMFSCKNEAQGRVIALSCLTTGRDILSVPEEYHLMNNKLTLQASAMLGRLVKRGGEYEVVAHSPERCAITIQYKGRSYAGEITWEAAKEEPFVYAGKQADVLELLSGPVEGRTKLRLSANYATPRRRMQHLWARVVSDSVRVVAPDLVSGSYTPEEVADFSGIVSTETQHTTTAIADPVAAALVSSVAMEQSGKASQADEAKFCKPGQYQSAEVALINVDQASEIDLLLKQLQAPPEAVAAICSKRGVSRISQLDKYQAAELIKTLQAKLHDKKLTAANAAAGSTSNTSESKSIEPGAKVTGPITEELEARIREKIKEVAQGSGQGKEFTDRIKLKLDAYGMKLRDLTFGDATKLLESLELMQIEEFFLHQLTVPEQGPTLHKDPGVDSDADPGNA